MVIETKKRQGRPPVDRNEVSSDLLATGEATMAQLAKLFRTDAKTLPKRLRGLQPAGVRSGASVYSIAEAATRIVKPGYSIEAYLRTMNHAELPPLLTKEYWNGARARQIYEENAGDLWRTPDIVEALAEAFKTCRMSLLLTSDSVERETNLSEVQRKIIKRNLDGAIDDLKEALVTRFKSYVPTTGPATLNIGLESGVGGEAYASAEADEEDPDDL